MLRRLFRQFRGGRAQAGTVLARAEALLARADAAGAIAAFREALALDPASAAACNGLGLALQRAGRLAEAADAFRMALELAPRDAALLNNLGTALRLAGDLDGAAVQYGAALAAAPGDALARFNLAVLAQKLGDADEAVRHLRVLVREHPAQPEFALALAQALNYSGEFDATTSVESLRQAAAVLVSGIEPMAPRARAAGAALRVGYLSPDFRNHPVMRFMEPVLAAHDTARFTVFCYDDAARVDAWTAKLDRLPVAVRRIAGLPDAEAAERIARDDLDLLVDLAGLTTGGRPGVLARRPARVQASYLGYLNTTGLSAVQWRITDREADPPGEAQTFYTERLAYLPRCQWLYAAPPEAGECGELPAARNGWPTLGAAHNFAKVGPAVLASWAAVAAAIPGSRIALAGVPPGSAQARVVDVFAAAGVDPERVSCRPGMPREAYFRFLSTLDVALDAFPYAGGTTTCDALWMGLPVVTLAGRHGSARSGASLLAAVGLETCIAQSVPAYVEACRRLCADRDALARLRAGMRARVAASPLMDAPGFVKGLEALYREIVAR